MAVAFLVVRNFVIGMSFGRCFVIGKIFKYFVFHIFLFNACKSTENLGAFQMLVKKNDYICILGKRAPLWAPGPNKNLCFMKDFRFLNFCLLLTLGMATLALNSCDTVRGDPNNPDNSGGSPTTDNVIMINGIKWTTRNVDKPGTFAAKPEDAGMFYQWNRKVAWPVTGDVSNWDSSYSTDTVWEKTTDPCPAGYRVPTLTEIRTLLDSDRVNYVWTSVNGISGGKFIDKASDNSIFLPAIGYRGYNNGAINYSGSSGGYWSSTQYHSYGAYGLIFGSRRADVFTGDYWFKRFGLSCRCVGE